MSGSCSSRQIAAHPLAEAELAHRRRQEVVERQHLTEGRQVGAEAVGRHTVDVAQQL